MTGGVGDVAELASIESLAGLFVGQPCDLEVLKDKPGRRRTARVTGSRDTAIVKAYASLRAPTVAARVAALAAGPDEPVVPRVVHLDVQRRIVVLSQVPGRPFSEFILDGDLAVCTRVGEALGRWHGSWAGRVPNALRPHPVERELELLADHIDAATPEVADAVRSRATRFAAPWPCSTIVHRDLYEEQIVVADRVGLIDLDDAAAGPPELDLGNLLAHIALLGIRHHQCSTDAVTDALMTGYRGAGPRLDDVRLRQCTWLSRLRLACIHDEPALLHS